MTDQLFLLLWLDRHNRAHRFAQFEKLLRLFPFSQRDQPQSTISIHAVDPTQPPLLEQPSNGPLDPSDILQTLRDYQGDDIAYRVETWWDLWQFENGEAELRPARVALSCFGPEFDSDTAVGGSRAARTDDQRHEDLRIDFGVDSHFLPNADVPASTTLIQSNIKSLLRLVHEIESVLPVDRRKLETESGENFADRLQTVLNAAPTQ
ncbi:MAG: hypothetical protein JO340_21470 [Acidobacteriaceae bacterium]|nr:hypothetical protein [Acidobacteriaceae bacterium]